MEKRLRNNRMGLACMMLLATLLLLWTAEAIGVFGFLPALLLPLPACVLVWERRWLAYALAYLVSAGLILLLPFPHYVWLCFVTVLGPYPPLRMLLARLRGDWVGSLLLLLLCNALAALGLFLLSRIGVHPFAKTAPLGLLLLITAFEIACLLLDVLYHLFHRLYVRRLKRFLSV